MENNQFDDHARMLFKSRTSRKRLLALMFGGTVGAVASRIMPDEASARPGRNRRHATVAAFDNSLTYRGQGLLVDDFGGFDLITERCGLENGADADGPYLLWVLTATGAKNADITGPWGTAPMTKFGRGTFKFVSDWYDPTTLPEQVSATYDGRVNNPQLVVSHGCRPYEQGAWCGPGFWKNAKPGAWALIGITDSALFGATVVPDFYDHSFLADPSLRTTLTDIEYKKGTLSSAPYGMTPFNATGAFLTNNITGYMFDFELFEKRDEGDTSYMCPIDSFGNFKK